MKQLLSFSLVLLLTLIVSCDKRNETINNNSTAIVGEWKSQKRVAWFTITQPNSSGGGIPIDWYYITPKDTFAFTGEKLTFDKNGKLFIESGTGIMNSETALPATIKFPKDTINYIYTDKDLTFDTNGFKSSLEIVELSAQHLTLYIKTILNGAVKEDWTFYSK